jgi:hypothetical protein
VPWLKSPLPLILCQNSNTYLDLSTSTAVFKCPLYQRHNTALSTRQYFSNTLNSAGLRPCGVLLSCSIYLHGSVNAFVPEGPQALLGSTAFVQLTRTQNLLLLSTASRRLEREYQLFMLEADVYSPSDSTNISEDHKAKNRLFVERIEDIISSHSSESGFQYLYALRGYPKIS